MLYRLQHGEHLFVTAVIEDEAKDQGNSLRHGEAPPDGLDIPGEAGDEPGDGQEDEQLAADADDHAVGPAADSLEDGSFREWMLDCLQVNNLLEESSGLHDKILLESIPSGGKWLNIIIDAIKGKRAMGMTYMSFFKDSPSSFIVHPWCLKLFKQRWYMLAKSEYFSTPRIYSLDRIQELSLSKTKLQVPERFKAEEYFSQYFGIIADKDIKPCFIEIWADSTQAKYFKSLPLHNSQTIKEEDENGTVFQYYLAPTYDFKQEILRYGSGVKVLSPKEFLEEIKMEIDNMANLYK